MSGRWKRWGIRAIVLVAGAILLVAVLFWTGLAEDWMRHEIVRQIEQKTGGRVELGGFHFRLWALRAELDDLTLHGREDKKAAPLFHADRVQVGVRILSFFGRKIALDELIVERPEVVVRYEKDGSSNLPMPRSQPSNRPWRETLFDLDIGHLELRDGSAQFNDRRIPLGVAGKNLEFALHSDVGAAGVESYFGSLQWQQVELAERHDKAFRFDIGIKFTLHRNAFELDDFVCKLPHSELNLRAELPSFAQPEWSLHYRGRLSLGDLRVILHEPRIPEGLTDFSGQARYAKGDWTAEGHYAAREIRLPYEWFHAGGLETWGDYNIAQQRLTVPNLGVKAFDGTVNGKLQMDFRGLAFRTETQLRGAKPSPGSWRRSITPPSQFSRCTGTARWT